MTPEKLSYDKSFSPALLGMWIFLATECLLFSALLFTLFLYRHQYAADFGAGTRHLSLFVGTLNTAILLTSSFTMALAVRDSESEHFKRAKKLMWTTAGLGLVFIVLKFQEYAHHYQEGLVPALNWFPDRLSLPHLPLFFVLYYFTTGLHAVHLMIGIVLISLTRGSNGVLGK